MAARPPRIDGLTGLTNRRTFDGFLRREYEARDEIAVLLFDIDNFKGYNDTYGHQAGDRCLQAVAKAIVAARNRSTLDEAALVGEADTALYEAKRLGRLPRPAIRRERLHPALWRVRTG